MSDFQIDFEFCGYLELIVLRININIRYSKM